MTNHELEGKLQSFQLQVVVNETVLALPDRAQSSAYLEVQEKQLELETVTQALCRRKELAENSFHMFYDASQSTFTGSAMQISLPLCTEDA